MIETVVAVLILILRMLIVYQMMNSVWYIKTVAEKWVALTGAFLYSGYCLYAFAAAIPVPAINILPLIGLLLGFLALNKYLKKKG